MNIKIEDYNLLMEFKRWLESNSQPIWSGTSGDTLEPISTKAHFNENDIHLFLVSPEWLVLRGYVKKEDG